MYILAEAEKPIQTLLKRENILFGKFEISFIEVSTMHPKFSESSSNSTLGEKIYLEHKNMSNNNRGLGSIAPILFWL